MFFSFEGIDGSGKSTQAKLLAETLRDRGHTVVEVREPGGTALGEKIRALLLDPASDVAARSELLLFSAARAQLVDRVIQPALADGAVVIADRFYDSTTAYQGGGRGVAGAPWLASLHQFVTAGCIPNRTYFIDVPVPIASSRRLHRPADRMETGGDLFYQSVRDAYLALSESDRILTLDGTRSIAALRHFVERDVLTFV